MTTPEPIDLHKRRLHDLHARLADQEDAACAPPRWRRPGIVTGRREAARYWWMLPVGLVMAWFGFKVAEAFASGRWPW